MSEKEKQVVEKLKEAIPKMSDFDKGYILGKVESMADEKKNNEKESEGQYERGNNNKQSDTNRDCIED